MGDIFKLIGDLGMPIAVALVGGYFVYLTIKLLLQGVLGSIKGMAGIIMNLNNKRKKSGTLGASGRRTKWM